MALSGPQHLVLAEEFLSEAKFDSFNEAQSDFLLRKATAHIAIAQALAFVAAGTEFTEDVPLIDPVLREWRILLEARSRVR